MTQVNSTLADRERLLRRTQLRRIEGSDILPGGLARDREDSGVESESSENELYMEVGQQGMIDDQPSSKRKGKSKHARRGVVGQYHEEVYDDTDFFQTILQDIISSGGSGAGRDGAAFLGRSGLLRQGE